MSHHDHRHHHEHDHGHEEHHHGHEKSPHPHDEHRESGDRPRPEPEGKLSERSRLIKVLEHWIHHNEDHARSYGEWAGRARGMGEEATGAILEGIAAETVRQNEKFQEALKLMLSESASR